MVQTLAGLEESMGLTQTEEEEAFGPRVLETLERPSHSRQGFITGSLSLGHTATGRIPRARALLSSGSKSWPRAHVPGTPAFHAAAGSLMPVSAWLSCLCHPS